MLANYKTASLTATFRTPRPNNEKRPERRFSSTRFFSFAGVSGS
jgi:hypothetical protein